MSVKSFVSSSSFCSDGCV